MPPRRRMKYRRPRAARLTPVCCHTDYTHCDRCGRNGAYYFGDAILAMEKKGSYTKWTRAHVLEAVLEWIESDPAIASGKETFLRRDLPQQFGLRADSRATAALKWLRYRGILELDSTSYRTKNVWRVRRNAEEQPQGPGQ